MQLGFMDYQRSRKGGNEYSIVIVDAEGYMELRKIW